MKQLYIAINLAALLLASLHAAPVAAKKGSNILGEDAPAGKAYTYKQSAGQPRQMENIDTSVVAYLWFNPAFAPADVKDPEIDVLRYVKPGLAPAIVFFGDQDTWKKGWDTAQAKWKAQGNQTIDLRIGPGQSHSFFNKEPWQSLTLIAADRFLVKLGLLTGEPTKAMPASGEKLVSADGTVMAGFF